MEAWWQGLGSEPQVYYAIAIAASALLVLQLVLMLFGLDADIGADVDLDADVGGASGDAGTGVLSVRAIIGFFTGFGWGGVAAVNAGLTGLAAALAALASGGVFMLGVVVLVRGLLSLQASGAPDYANAIGQTGAVYLPVPPNMEGPGQVEVLVQGRLAIVQAFTRADRRLENRERVRVVAVMDRNTVVVEPLRPTSHLPSEAEG